MNSKEDAVKLRFLPIVAIILILGFDALLAFKRGLSRFTDRKSSGIILLNGVIIIPSIIRLIYAWKYRNFGKDFATGMIPCNEYSGILNKITPILSCDIEYIGHGQEGKKESIYYLQDPIEAKRVICQFTNNENEIKTILDESIVDWFEIEVICTIDGETKVFKKEYTSGISYHKFMELLPSIFNIGDSLKIYINKKSSQDWRLEDISSRIKSLVLETAEDYTIRMENLNQ